jgi:hypothetical protein
MQSAAARRAMANIVHRLERHDPLLGSVDAAGRWRDLAPEHDTWSSVDCSERGAGSSGIYAPSCPLLAGPYTSVSRSVNEIWRRSSAGRWRASGLSGKVDLPPSRRIHTLSKSASTWLADRPLVQFSATFLVVGPLNPPDLTLVDLERLTGLLKACSASSGSCVNMSAEWGTLEAVPAPFEAPCALPQVRRAAAMFRWISLVPE